MVLFNAILVSVDRMDGLIRYAVEVMKRMDQNKTIFIINKRAADYFKLKHYIEVPESLNKSNVFIILKRFFWYIFQLPKIIKKKGVSLFYSPFHEGQLYKLIPQVITIHDLLPLRYPETFPRLKYYFQWFVPFYVRASSHIVAISDSTKKDIELFYRTKAPVTVLYNGCNFIKKDIPSDKIQSIKDFYKLNKYIFFLSENRPYKNLAGAIEGFSLVKNSNLEFAIGGKIEGLNAKIIQLPQKYGVSSRVKFLGFIKEDDLQALYQGAEMFLFPSFYEGFGAPLLEAMSCGCPVIASQTSSIPEVCGNAAYYINPNQPETIARAINEISSDHRVSESLRKKGYIQYKKFNWDQTVEKINGIISTLKLS